MEVYNGVAVKNNGTVVKCSKLKIGRILNEVLKTEEWTEKMDAVVDSSKAVIGGDL